MSVEPRCLFQQIWNPPLAPKRAQKSRMIVLRRSPCLRAGPAAASAEAVDRRLSSGKCIGPVREMSNAQ